MSKYAAVIPAAGLSSRMGAFKPLLQLGSKAMIDHVIDTLMAGGVSQVIVVTGHNADLLEAYLKGRPVLTVFNAGYAQNQMFDSVKLGLAALADEYDGVYITPGDVPLFSEETVLALRKCGAEAARPVLGEKGGHPIYLSREAARKVLTSKAAGGLKGALNELRLVNIQLEDRGMTLDADTPEAFETLKNIFKNS